MRTRGSRNKALRRLTAVACIIALAMMSGCTPTTPRGPDNAPVTQPAALAPPPILTPGGNGQPQQTPDDQSSGPPAAGTTPHLQWITGLGVNANVHSWHGGELKPAIDQIAQLGQISWRVIIDRADWEPARHGSADAYDWAYYDKIYSTGKMADLFDTIAYINSISGQTVSINVMGGVSNWMGGTKITRDLEDYWVRMIASMVYYGIVVRKLDIPLISPMNEPDLNGIEGPVVDPGQYVRLMDKLSTQLDRLGLTDVRYVGPDTSSQDKAVHDYLPAIAADPALMARMAHFGIHSYDGTSAEASAAVSAVVTGAPDVWVTEFSGPCPGCDTGAPNPNRWDTAQATADMAIALLHQGVSGLQFYDAWDGFYEHHGSIGYWGLLSHNPSTHTYTPRKDYFIFKQLTESVPSDSAVIECTSTVAEVALACFWSPATGRVAVFGSYHGTVAQNVGITLTQLTQSAGMAVYRTDADANMLRAENTRLSQGTITVSLSPLSVFSLTTLPGS